MANAVKYKIKFNANTDILDQVERDIKQIGNRGSASVKKLNASFSQTREGVQSISQNLQRAQAALGVFLAAGASLGALRGLQKQVDLYTSMTARLKLVTESEQEAAAAQRELFGLAQQTRAALAPTVNLYTKIARATQNSNLSLDQQLRLVKTINEALVISGATGEEARAALQQLGQGLASGTLRGEELNSVLEQVPRLARAIAEGAGVAYGDLRDLAAQGFFTTQRVIDALMDQGAALDAQFAKMPTTIDQSLTQIGNAWLKYIGQANEAAGASRDVAGALSFVAQNFQTLADAAIRLAGVLAAVFSARLVGRMGAYIQSTAASIKATNAEAAAVVRRTAAIKADAEARLANASARAGQIKGFKRLTAVQNNVLRAKRRLTRATQAHTMALRRASAMTLALRRASGALRKGMSFLGGPLGVIFLAATALTYFISTSESAAEKADRLARKVDKAAKNFKELTRNQKDLALLEARKALDAKKQQIDALVETLTEGRKVPFRHLGPFGTIETEQRIVPLEGEALTRALAKLDTNKQELKVILDDIAVLTGQATPDSAGGKGGAGAGDDAAAKKIRQTQTALAHLKALNQRTLATLDAQFKAHQVSLAAYYDQRVALARKSIDAEIAALEKRAGAEDATASQKAEIEQQIIALETRRRQVGVEAARAQAQAEAKLAEQLEQVRVELLKSQGKTAQAARLEIETQYAELIATLKANGDAAGVALIRKLINVKEAEAQLDALETKVSAAISAMREAEQAVQAEQAAGLITDVQARERILELHRQTAAALREQVPAMRALVAATGNPQAVRNLETLLGKIEKLGRRTNEFRLKVEGIGTTALAQFFEDIRTGAKSAGDAFSDMVGSFSDAIARFLEQKLAQQFVDYLFRAFGSEPKPSGGGPDKKMASGGLVRGPGTATSDSIAARLSDGEFVMRAAAVRRYGANFMAALNRGLMPARSNHFAAGGLVGAGAGGGEMEVNVYNSSGAPARVQKRQVGRKQVADIFVGAVAADIERGGMAAQAIQNVYGVRRRGRG